MSELLGNPGRPTMPRPEPDPVEPVGFDADGHPIYAQEPSPGKAIPTTCLRVLHSPRGECPGDCFGRQRDGGCLCDVVRAAEAAGAEWSFEIDGDGYWINSAASGHL